MASLLDHLVQFVATHAWLAYGTVFVAALLEAVPVLGSFMPGSSLIIGLSAFVAAGDLDLTGVLASAITGALLGDGTAFWLGYVRQRRILAAWPLSAYPGLIAGSEAFFRNHGALAVLLARFVPPVRAFVPVTAGALGMPGGRFYPISIVAICLWACAHVLPGALAGTLWKQYGREFEHVVLPVLLVAAAAAMILWIARVRRTARP